LKKIIADLYTVYTPETSKHRCG